MATKQGAPAGVALFAQLLRQYRLAAGLSQEALAERAGLSERAISALERGINRAPRLETVSLLVTALALTSEQRTALLAAARPGQLPLAPVPTVQPSAEASTAPPRHNLPVPPTPLVGREQDVTAVLARLRESGTRLLSLTGVGGVGKTRLALEVARAALADFPDGVWLVGLAPLSDPDRVAGAITQVLDLRETGGRSVREELVEHLHGKQLLLVLDNFEHLLPAAPLVAELLAACPQLRVLVTSRAALHLRGNQQCPVLPLALPADPMRMAPFETLAGVAAVALFVQRAQAAQPSFALTAASATAVAAICRRLDGLPLALELAAARVTLLPPTVLLQRLARRLPVLTGGAVDTPERQRTMRATIAWSYDLLHAGEQALFRRLAVFAGGCTLAAEAVCAVGDELAGDLLDWLSDLVDGNLVQVAGTEEEPRFGMLETVREYGLEQLAADGEEAMARDRHLAWCAALAETAAPELIGAAQATWLARLEAEHDNLSAALDWSLTRDRATTEGLQLVGALWRFWVLHGHLTEGRHWLAEALDQDHEPAAPAALRARALNGAGNLAFHQGDYTEARAWHEESLALKRALGDRSGVAVSLSNLGLVAVQQGDYAGARALHEESLAIERELGNTWGIAGSLNNLGQVAEW